MRGYGRKYIHDRSYDWDPDEPVRETDRFKRLALNDIANHTTAGFLAFENKFFDAYLESSLIPANDTVTGGVMEMDPIAVPLQGDDPTNRTGNRIVVNTLDVELYVYVEPGEGVLTFGTTIMLALVQDTQTNGALCTSQQIFAPYLPSGIPYLYQMTPFAPPNLLYDDRFIIHKRSYVTLDPHIAWNGAAYGNCGVGKHVNWHLDLDVPVSFTDGYGGSLANVIDNSFHIVAFATSTTLSPYLQWRSRIRFIQ